jgi:hypothetical protein
MIAARGCRRAISRKIIRLASKYMLKGIIEAQLEHSCNGKCLDTPEEREEVAIEIAIALKEWFAAL